MYAARLSPFGCASSMAPSSTNELLLVQRAARAELPAAASRQGPTPSSWDRPMDAHGPNGERRRKRPLTSYGSSMSARSEGADLRRKLRAGKKRVLKLKAAKRRRRGVKLSKAGLFACLHHTHRVTYRPRRRTIRTLRGWASRPGHDAARAVTTAAVSMMLYIVQYIHMTVIRMCEIAFDFLLTSFLPFFALSFPVGMRLGCCSNNNTVLYSMCVSAHLWHTDCSRTYRAGKRPTDLSLTPHTLTNCSRFNGSGSRKFKLFPLTAVSLFSINRF